MTKAHSRHQRSLDFETREAARAAARRPGESLADWFDELIRQTVDAAEDDENDEDRVEAAARRLARSRATRGREGRPWREGAPEEGRDPRDDGSVRRAIVALAARAERSERETARAFTDIAGVLARTRPGREDAKAFAALGERLDRIESRLDEQPAANARPIRGALARLESRLDLLASEDRAAGFEHALNGLDRRLADIARRLDDEARARAAISDDGSPALERAPRGPAPRFDALQQSIDSIARQLDGVRQDSTERADLEIVATRQVEELRRDIQDMAKAIRDLAPRASIAAIETTLRDLCARVESQRERGVADGVLAPAERIVGELRAVMKDLDPSPFVRNLRVDIETIGHRLDRLQAQSLDASVVRDLARETHEIKRQLATLLARPMPLEKIETRLLDLARRIDGLNFSSGASAADLGEMIGAIRSIVSAETGKNFETFNNRLEQIARKLDDVAARADAAPLEEFVATLAKKIDSALDGKAQEAQAHMPAIEEIGRKIDRLETRFMEAPPAEPGADRQFADLATRIDELRQTLAQRIEGAADGGQFDPQALERQLAQLSYKIDRLDDPAANSWLGSLLSRPDQHSRLDEISERLESMRAALESRVEDGARIEARQSDLAALVEKLALRMNEAIDLEAGGAQGSVESRIDDLIERMDGARVAMTDAAEAAVRRATQEILREAAGVDVSALRATVESELFDIRKAQEESGQRARETLTAVHETLERVVDRLTLFEDELNELRAAPARREPAPSGASLETDERSLHRSSVQADFIAAARRAAQQAALEADLQHARRARSAGRREETPGVAPEEGGVVVRIGSALQERKRPLLLGLAALAMLVGAYQIARQSLEDGAPLAPVAQNEQRGAEAPGKRVAENAPAPKPTAKPAERVAGAQAPIDPTPTGAISAPPLSAGAAFAAIESLAVKGEASAQYEIAARLVEGRGVARDAKAAAQWFEKSAAQGVAPAQYRIGSMYEKGIGVERDYARARKWYALAAEAGNARAMHNLAVLLAEGGEDKPDYAGAGEWFRKAAEYGVRDSQFNLAILYARGLGVSQDLKQAYVWFSAAADQGDEDAGKKRDEMGARLDSKELAAAKALAGAFRPREPSREANEAPTLKSGGDTIREPAFVKPAPKPVSKPKFSQM